MPMFPLESSYVFPPWWWLGRSLALGCVRKYARVMRALAPPLAPAFVSLEIISIL
jgi:hypothetical protein